MVKHSKYKIGTKVGLVVVVGRVHEKLPLSIDDRPLLPLFALTTAEKQLQD